MSKLYHYNESGIPNLFLKNIEYVVCEECGHAHSARIPKINELHRVVGIYLASRDGSLNGRYAKFLRKHLGFSRTDWATMLDKDYDTVLFYEDCPNDVLGVMASLRIKLAYLDNLKDKSESKDWQIEVENGNIIAEFVGKLI